MNNKKNPAAVVVGSNINALSIISELHEKGIKNIILIRKSFYLATFSYKIKKRIKTDYTKPENLKNTLFYLKKNYDFLVIYPTADIEIEILYEIYNDISDFCFLPFNKNNVVESLKKTVQYEFCRKLKIPYPKTVYINEPNDFDKIGKMQFPLIIKPSTRKDLKIPVFRNLVLKNKNDYEKNIDLISDFVDKKITFIISEIIPGDGSNIYAYVAYRNKNGEILNEWTGKKLSQYPDDFGVFASASNQAPVEVLQQGRTLLNEMNLYGINEPEFKYDHRDGKYKLMEINLRSMMWHRVGNLSGVNIQYTQWADALNLKIETQKQNKTDKIHFFYFHFELINLLCRKNYWKIFKYNLFKGDKIRFAELQKGDILPVIFNAVLTFLRIIKRCLKL